MKKALIILLVLSLGFGCTAVEKNEEIPTIQGLDGQDGQDGEDGTDGEDGNDGTDGNDGEDGEDGTDGEDGADGENCYDGLTDQNGDNVVDIYDCRYIEEKRCTKVINTELCARVQTRFVIKLSIQHKPDVFLSENGLHFIEYEDDKTALLCGNVQNNKTNKRYEIEIKFTGKLDTPQDNTTHQCFHVDGSLWNYYTSFEGWIKSVDGTVDLQLKDIGKMLQIGVDANVLENRPDYLGVAGWFTVPNNQYIELGELNFNIFCKE
ncbi:hypothetical protein [Aquimarina algiphila]|uniref:Collagen-like protein n=1 Tax=Aquimarina algiphila TaxID=2047982 RepID=A0A554VRH7_9FLAO|nr:hypothetical protein [Aquimarina algiphila]TSE11257.1 hypothetical protein FOF46_01115 [Aquimarina algiphila]